MASTEVSQILGWYILVYDHNCNPQSAVTRGTLTSKPSDFHQFCWCLWPWSEWRSDLRSAWPDGPMPKPSLSACQQPRSVWQSQFELKYSVKQVLPWTWNLVPCPLQGAATWRIQQHDPRLIGRLLSKFQDDIHHLPRNVARLANPQKKSTITLPSAKSFSVGPFTWDKYHTFSPFPKTKHLSAKQLL